MGGSECKSFAEHPGPVPGKKEGRKKGREASKVRVVQILASGHPPVGVGVPAAQARPLETEWSDSGGGRSPPGGLQFGDPPPLPL